MIKILSHKCYFAYFMNSYTCAYMHEQYKWWMRTSRFKNVSTSGITMNAVDRENAEDTDGILHCILYLTYPGAMEQHKVF